MYATFTMTKRSKALYSARMPPVIGSQSVEIETDVVNINIPTAVLKVVFEEGQQETKPPRGHQTSVY